MPRLKGIAQGDLDGVDAKFAHAGKSEFEVRCKPGGVKVKASITQLGQYIVKIHFDKTRKHKAIVQCSAPTRHRRAVTLMPETCHKCAQQQLLNHTHSGVRWHFKGAQFKQAQTPC